MPTNTLTVTSVATLKVLTQEKTLLRKLRCIFKIRFFNSRDLQFLQFFEHLVEHKMSNCLPSIKGASFILCNKVASRMTLKRKFVAPFGNFQ